MWLCAWLCVSMSRDLVLTGRKGPTGREYAGAVGTTVPQSAFAPVRVLWAFPSAGFWHLGSSCCCSDHIQEESHCLSWYEGMQISVRGHGEEGEMGSTALLQWMASGMLTTFLPFSTSGQTSLCTVGGDPRLPEKFMFPFRLLGILTLLNGRSPLNIRSGSGLWLVVADVDSETCTISDVDGIGEGR